MGNLLYFLEKRRENLAVKWYLEQIDLAMRNRMDWSGHKLKSYCNNAGDETLLLNLRSIRPTAVTKLTRVPHMQAMFVSSTK